MDWINLLGMVAGGLTTIAFLPQLFKTWRSRSASDISLSWLVTFTLGILLWLIYGLCIASLPVIVANGTTLVLTLIILVFKFRYSR
ncbi:MAG TPA: SemiSWEET transporter [Chroococcidiopsis sp.]